MAISARQAVRHYQERREQALEVINHYRSLHQKLESCASTLEQDYAAASQMLSVAYLPEFNPAAVAHMERLTGFRGFSRRNPFQAMEHERATLRRTATQIQADERFVRRQYLVGPQGELTRKRDEAASLLAPWQEECDKFEKLPGFLDLIAVEYDTPNFSVSWLRPSYWRYWAQGDKICELLGMDDFGDDVLPAYMKFAVERDKWKREVERVDAKIQEVHNLVEEHNRSLTRISQLPQLYLAQCQKALGEYLSDADLSLLEEWLGEGREQHREILIGLRRLSGIQAKKRFLEECSMGLTATIQDLKTRAQKYNRKAQKWNRPKRRRIRVSERELDRKFGTKVPKLIERRNKLDRMIERMMAYEEYESFSLDNDPQLWWIEFTGKRPSRISPHLRGWYDRNPRPRVRHDRLRDSRRTAAAAMAMRERDDLGYLS